MIKGINFLLFIFALLFFTHCKKASKQTESVEQIDYTSLMNQAPNPVFIKIGRQIKVKEYFKLKK